ncbi:MAG: hypothetical protein JKY60_17055 [Kordiimonadaceae bacterium]|nr:hypothetical protein [Kordiimonadaceae bacterium]
MTDINHLNTDEFGVFLGCVNAEKVIVISLEGCVPCDMVMDDFGALKDSGSIDDLAVFKMQFPKGKNFPSEIADEIGVRHFPTIFYFSGETYKGRAQGMVPKTHKSSEVSLLNWMAKMEKRAA